MADSWIEELERLGLAWRLRNSPDSAVSIVSSRTVELLSPDEAAATAQRLTTDPLGAAVTAAGLRGQPLSQGDLLSDASAIAEGLLSGKLVAFRVRSTSGITAGEAAAIEAMLANHSVPAPPPTRPPPAPNTPLHNYKVCVRADTGKPVSGVKLKLEIEDTPRMATTGADGTATVEWFSTSPADVRVLEPKALRDKLAAEWANPVSADLPTAGDVYRRTIGDNIAPLRAQADGTSTIILCRKHTFELQVYDQFGQPLNGIGLVMNVDGRPKNVSTDGSGRARYADAADSAATARLADPKKARDAVAAAAASPPANPDLGAIADARTILLGHDETEVTLGPDVPNKIVMRRKVVRVRLIGMFFDHSKTFLLPEALKGIKRVKEIYDEFPDANLLVVGHTDTKHLDSPDADPDFNKKLSLDRAKSVAQYLTDNVDGWYAWYESWGERLWGTTEDTYLLSNVPSADPPYYQDGDDFAKALKKYQSNKGLPSSGRADKATRRALITDYMSADGTTLPSGAKLTPHGCGHNFPDVPTGPNDDVPKNRRVEIFVFDGPIVPRPAGDFSEAESPDYSAWVAQVAETVDFQQTGSQRIRITLLDSTGRWPAPRTPFRFTVGSRVQSGWTESRGTIVVDASGEESLARVEWGWPRGCSPGAEQPFAYSEHARIYLETASTAPDSSCMERIFYNLGYKYEDDNRNRATFAREYAYGTSTDEIVRSAHETGAEKKSTIA